VRFRLIPRDNGFYPLFEQQASVAVDTAIQLEKLMASLPIVADRVDTIVAAERAGDEVMRLVREPTGDIDRHALRSRGHSVARQLARRLCSTRCAPPPTRATSINFVAAPGVTDLVALLRKIVEANRSLVGKLSTLNNVHGDIDLIDSLESEADATYRRIMAELFSGNQRRARHLEMERHRRSRRAGDQLPSRTRAMSFKRLP
jgi:hypothetical protein